MASAKASIVVNDVPLLVENDLSDEYHVVLVVVAPLERRISWLMRDRGMTEREARARIAAQASDSDREDVADIVLRNDGDTAGLNAAVDRVWCRQLVPWSEQGRFS